jgi:histidinol-phosphate phosphatase family protein
VHKAVFLDRDGTINRDVPYCRRPEDFELLPTVAEGIRLLNESGFKVVVVTNQSGIARGYFTGAMLQKIHRKMLADLSVKGAFIDAIYYCPHHPDDGCECRKPGTALFHRAEAELDIDLTGSYIIGDKLLDIAAARELKCQAALVPSSEPEMTLVREGRHTGADFTGTDFYSAAAWVAASANILVKGNRRKG